MKRFWAEVNHSYQMVSIWPEGTVTMVTNKIESYFISVCQ